MAESTMDLLSGADDTASEMEEMRRADAAPDPAPEIEEDAPALEAEDDAPEMPAEESVPKSTMVPYGALREERDKRQALEEQIQTYSQRLAQMESNLQTAIARAQAVPAQPAEPPPDFDLDPDAYTKSKLDAIEQKLARDEQLRQQQAQRVQQQKQAQQFLSMYSDAARSFAQTKPDAGEAYNYAINKFDEDLKLRGVHDASERARRLEYEEEQIVLSAFQQGVNPAQRIYDLAVSRGYKPASADNKIGRVAAAQAATNPAATVGGSEAAPPVSLARLAQMDDDDFDKGWEKARKAGLLG